ncbi:SI1L3 protein, partial [Ciccaba nigrolineata]|nr:SI1L3 protein [Ciccaba nigrolineata]
MGVRARIADWPPKRDATSTKDPPGPCREAPSPRRGFPVAPPRPPGAVSAFQAFPRRRSKDVEFQEGWPRSPAKASAAPPPLRHRSSSEVTLSECDADEAPEAP